MIESFLKDLRQSLRMFWQSPGFTAAAVSALALGIGANTAIFSVVNAVLLKPVPFPTGPDGDDQTTRRRVSTAAAHRPISALSRAKRGPERRCRVQHRVVNYTGGLFPTVSFRPGVGGFLQTVRGARAARPDVHAAEDLPDGDKVVVLSYQVWARRFDHDPDIVGKTMSLSGNPYTIIGVLDPSVDFRNSRPIPRSGSLSSSIPTRRIRALLPRRRPPRA